MGAKDVALALLRESQDKALQDLHPDEAKKHARPTTLPMSDDRHVEDGDMGTIQNFHDYHGTKGKVQKVHPDHLRASQPWIDNRWKPEHSPSEDHPDHDEPLGFRFPDSSDPDHVHIFNGHHRAEQAHKTGQPFKMRVITHTDRHDRKMENE